MKTDAFFAFSTMIIVAALQSWAFQTNYTSIRPGTVWLANDSVHIDCHGGNIIYSADKKKFYWYGEHYAPPAGVSCYSSTDLYNWIKEGIVLQKGVIQVCERPKVIYSPSIKKYVMWFHYDNSNYTLAHLAVSTADSATGQFTMLNHLLPNGHQSRDIGMFTDTTGKTYIVYAADQTNVTIRMVELTADYTNITSSDVDLRAHCEGPGMLKYKGNYYMITSPCLGWSPGQATWYMSPAVTGTYVNKGDPCINDNSRNTFNSQSCFVFKIPGYENAYMYMGDRWNGSGNKNSQYVFLPIAFSATGALQLKFSTSWDLGVFTPTGTDGRMLQRSLIPESAPIDGACRRVYDLRGRRVDGMTAYARSSVGPRGPGWHGVLIAESEKGAAARLFLTINNGGNAPHR